jgi:selenocysteine lyase/cysteine desulfurase
MNDVVRAQFALDKDRIYLDAATYGLPTHSTVDAYRAAIDAWQCGTAVWDVDWEPEGERCRELFARLIGAQPEHISLLPTVSTGIGAVAASMPHGSTVLVPQEEFTSVLLPFMALSERNGIRVREVPWEHLGDYVTPDVSLVACSLTRMQDGRVVDLGRLSAQTSAVGAALVVDATHAIPFVDVEPHLRQVDYLVCHGYKHLLSPRGTAFAYINPRFWPELLMIHASWRPAAHPFGPPLPVRTSAAAFDVSLAWHAWVGTRPALEALLGWKADGTIAFAKSLADRLAATLGLAPPGASLVCVPVPDPEKRVEELEALGVRCAGRGRNLRFSPHVWNTEAEIDRAAELVLDRIGSA